MCASARGSPAMGELLGRPPPPFRPQARFAAVQPFRGPRRLCARPTPLPWWFFSSVWCDGLGERAPGPFALSEWS
jgi:hypothetical protein